MSDLLYATPRRWTGLARILDIGSTYEEFNVLPPELADAVALRSDVAVVHRHMREATLAVLAELPDRESR